MTTVADLLDALECAAPSEAAFDWDAVGLQVGDRAAEVGRVVVALDPSPEAAAHALEIGAQALLTHHPLLFRPLASVATGTRQGRTIRTALAGELAVVAAHTNWDMASPGLNDALAEALGLTDVRPFGTALPMRTLRLAVYVPATDAQRLIDALSDVGAGAIGDYRRCAFWTPGMGTFEPLAGAHPAIGTVGRREEVEEVRVDMLLARALRDRVVRTLRQVHPYEAPAFSFIEADADLAYRAGRIGRLPDGLAGAGALRHVEAKLGTSATLWGEIGNVVAVVGGAAGSEWRGAVAAGAGALITGEVKHDQAADAPEGFGMIQAGHYATEMPGVHALARAMRRLLPEVRWSVFAPEPGSAGRPHG